MEEHVAAWLRPCTPESELSRKLSSSTDSVCTLCVPVAPRMESSRYQQRKREELGSIKSLPERASVVRRG